MKSLYQTFYPTLTAYRIILCYIVSSSNLYSSMHRTHRALHIRPITQLQIGKSYQNHKDTNPSLTVPCSLHRTNVLPPEQATIIDDNTLPDDPIFKSIMKTICIASGLSTFFACASIFLLGFKIQNNQKI